jgi:spore maturation protein SpmB
MYQTFRFQRVVLLGAAIGTAGLVFAAPQCCARALQQGLALCGGPLLVSLFPFLIVSALLMQSGAGEWLGVLFRPAARLIGIRAKSAGGVLIIGALGGFAPAASAAAQAVQTGQLSAKQASALLPACICSGPSFVILTVGEQMLGSRALGVRLFASQLLAGYLSAALLCRLQGGGADGKTLPQAAPDLLQPLDAIIAQAAVTYLKLCGFVLYFRLLAAGCGHFLPGGFAALPAMLLEVCSGCDYASRTGFWASSLCCAALSLQGASVLLQVRTICPPEISFRPLLAARLLHLPLSLALFYLGLPQQAVETFTTLPERVILMRRVPLDCALLAFALCCLTAWELCKACAEQKTPGDP